MVRRSHTLRTRRAQPGAARRSRVRRSGREPRCRGSSRSPAEAHGHTQIDAEEGALLALPELHLPQPAANRRRRDDTRERPLQRRTEPGGVPLPETRFIPVEPQIARGSEDPAPERESKASAEEEEILRGSRSGRQLQETCSFGPVQHARVGESGAARTRGKAERSHRLVAIARSVEVESAELVLLTAVVAEPERGARRQADIGIGGDLHAELISGAICRREALERVELAGEQIEGTDTEAQTTEGERQPTRHSVDAAAAPVGA